MSSGGDVVQHVPMLCKHFKTVGAPVMIGEWVYAGACEPLRGAHSSWYMVYIHYYTMANAKTQGTNMISSVRACTWAS